VKKKSSFRRIHPSAAAGRSGTPAFARTAGGEPFMGGAPVRGLPPAVDPPRIADANATPQVSNVSSDDDTSELA
jgi:hypothetical protein